MVFPSISIAIPTLNEHDHIEHCLNSIFHQKYQGKLEVFIVDGGSTDDTVKIAKRFPVTILRNPLREAEYGKKIALMKSTGKYFMILDCDMGLVGDHWFEKMVSPLEKDTEIVGSWTRFVSLPGDAPLNRYITFDPIQRDPLFCFLTPSTSSCITKKYKEYWITEYRKGKILPASFCLYRRKELLTTAVAEMKKYMELDTMVIMVENGRTSYAYVPDIGIHHPFLTTLSNLVRKRKRNLETMYFNQPNKRYWTWIDWSKRSEFIKLFLWLMYCYTIMPSIIVGFYKSLRYRDPAGLYELPFNIMTTNVIIGSFITNKEGRVLLSKTI
ncbi:MAG TPA: glycosyltransferase family 2 protein [Patescibacteria group bacterium]|nr:glycosyltransferase family 2 protein [Patescibacteria group bacterium]